MNCLKCGRQLNDTIKCNCGFDFESNQRVLALFPLNAKELNSAISKLEQQKRKEQEEREKAEQERLRKETEETARQERQRAAAEYEKLAERLEQIEAERTALQLRLENEVAERIELSERLAQLQIGFDSLLSHSPPTTPTAEPQEENNSAPEPEKATDTQPNSTASPPTPNPLLFICPACDAKNSSLEYRCRECGVRIRSIRYDRNKFATALICPVCDSINSSLERVCRECGSRLKTTTINCDNI